MADFRNVDGFECVGIRNESEARRGRWFGHNTAAAVKHHGDPGASSTHVVWRVPVWVRLGFTAVAAPPRSSSGGLDKSFDVYGVERGLAFAIALEVNAPAVG